MIKTLMLGISLSFGLVSSPVWSSSYFGDGQCGVIVASRQTLSEARCPIPDVCIDERRLPLFIARATLRELIAGLEARAFGGATR